MHFCALYLSIVKISMLPSLVQQALPFFAGGVNEKIKSSLLTVLKACPAIVCAKVILFCFLAKACLCMRLGHLQCFNKRNIYFLSSDMFVSFAFFLILLVAD